MKMGIRGPLFCFVLCLALGRISGKVLKTLEDLKEFTDFGKQNPRQGLEFLCWLLNQAKMDQNGNLRLNFNPTEELFSFHQYKNYDLAFPDLSNTNFLYFSLGNLCAKNVLDQLPGYFIEIFRKSRNHPQRNIDRIVIQIRKDDPTAVDKVFITQHFEDKKLGSDYDQNHTHEISKELLKIIAELCRSEDDDRDRNPDQNDPDYKRFQKIQSMFSKAPYQHLFLYLVNYKPDKNVKEHKTSAKSDNTLDELCCEEMDTDLELCLEPITTLESSENREKDQIAPTLLLLILFIFSILYFLFIYPLTSLFSLGFYIFSSPYYLAFYIFSSLYSLVISPFSSLFSLVVYIFSSLYSLVICPLASLFSPVFYIFSSLYSLVICPLASLFSPVFYIFSSLYSLVICPLASLFSPVFYIFSSLYSLVICPLASLFSPVFYIFSSLYSLVICPLASLFSPVFYIFSSLYSLVICPLASLFSPVFYIFSILLSLVLYPCSKLYYLVLYPCSLYTLLIGIVVIVVVRVVMYTLTESRAEPDFVRVSHGRPGL